MLIWWCSNFVNSTRLQTDTTTWNILFLSSRIIKYNGDVITHSGAPANGQTRYRNVQLCRIRFAEPPGEHLWKWKQNSINNSFVIPSHSGLDDTFTGIRVIYMLCARNKHIPQPTPCSCTPGWEVLFLRKDWHLPPGLMLSNQARSKAQWSRLDKMCRLTLS